MRLGQADFLDVAGDYAQQAAHTMATDEMVKTAIAQTAQWDVAYTQGRWAGLLIGLGIGVVIGYLVKAKLA